MRSAAAPTLIAAIRSALTIVLFALLDTLRDKHSNEYVGLDAPLTGRPSGQQLFSLVLTAAILVCTLVFHMPTGFVALSAGLLLAIVNMKEHKTFIGGGVLVHRTVGGRHHHLRLPASARGRHRYPRPDGPGGGTPATTTASASTASS